MYCSVWCLGWTLMLGRYFWHSYLVKIYNVGINGEFSPVLQVLALQAIFKEGIELVNQLLYHETCLTHSSACLLCVSSGGGTRWHSWLRHCATSRKVTGSIPYGVNGIFHWHNPSGHTVTLGLTPSLTEMSTRNRRPVCRADNLTTFMCRLSWNRGASTYWNPQGLSRPVMGLLYLYWREYVLAVGLLKIKLSWEIVTSLQRGLARVTYTRVGAECGREGEGWKTIHLSRLQLISSGRTAVSYMC